MQQRLCENVQAEEIKFLAARNSTACMQILSSHIKDRELWSSILEEI